MSSRPAGPDGTALLIFATVVLLGGANFIAVRYSNLELPPFWGAGLRFSMAAALFGSLVVVLRLEWPRGAALLRTVAFGLLNFGAKRVSVANPIVTNAVAVTAGAAFLLALSLLAGEAWSWPRRTATLAAVLYMVVLGSVLLFGLSLLLIRRWTPSASSYAIVLFPVVAPLLESAVAGVPTTADIVIAGLIVVAGVWFGALAPQSAARAHVRSP